MCGGYSVLKGIQGGSNIALQEMNEVSKEGIFEKRGLENTIANLTI